ncbi:MAG TPA: hypothetical protein DCY89_05695 [Gammaproteobacteria bacterium]|nr:hypothetical protein [Gammaproteobacteria bacterium]
MVNLTQHPATPEQLAAGVVDLGGPDLLELKELLTFDSLPSAKEVQARAWAISDIAADAGATEAMIGGAPYLMAPLERILQSRGIAVFYAFSVRETEEQTLPDGSVRKTAVFRHAGFVGRRGRHGNHGV